MKQDPLENPNGFAIWMDGANGSATFTDLYTPPKQITAYGTAAISTNQSWSGGSSLRIDGSSEAKLLVEATDLSPRTRDFEIEAMLRLDNTQAYQYLLSSSTNTYEYLQLAFNGMASNAIGLGRAWVDWPLVWTNHNIPNNTWFNLTIVRKNGYARCLINGVKLGNDILSGHDFHMGPNGVFIGHQSSTGSMTGYLQYARLTVGQSRHWEEFDIPSAGFTDDEILFSGAGMAKFSDGAIAETIRVWDRNTGKFLKDFTPDQDTGEFEIIVAAETVDVAILKTGYRPIMHGPVTLTA